ncbi:MAG: hypothetical protein RQ833_07830 [Sphingomonadaceae bacterium]|nr:hypothetical protein [Sphingomonadaceae bacterium]
MSAPPPTPPPDPAVDRAFAELLRAGDIQRALPPALIDKPKSPTWLDRLIEWLGHKPMAVQLLFWAGVAVLVAVILTAAYRYVSARRLSFGVAARGRPTADWWRPEGRAAAVALADADRLAAEGRYGEAAHLLLLKSVADIDRGRPGEVRRSLTAREIARLPVLPPDVAGAFGQIATVAEAGLFAGLEVARDGWERARAAYAGVAGLKAA